MGSLLVTEGYDMKKRGLIIFSICMFFFWLFALAGMQLERDGNIIWSFNYTVKLLVKCIILGLISGMVITWFFLIVQKFFPERTVNCSTVRRHGGKIFLISWGLVMLIWLPVFLAYYPGNCGYDIGGQTWYMISGNYGEHHPLAHTLLMEGFIHVGKLFGSVNLGMAAYVLFQMLWLSSSFAYGIFLLYKNGIAKSWLIILQLWAMFFIPHWYMSISTTKDVIFTASVLYMLLMLYQMIRDSRNSIKIDRLDVGLIINVVVMILFRNNGKYAFLVTIVIGIFLVIFNRKERKLYTRITILSMVSFFIASGGLLTLRQITNASRAPQQEMLSIPVQQLSRVMVYHGGIGILEEDDNSLSKIEKDFINDFIQNEAYKNYIPSVSDPVKSEASAEVIRYRLGEFIAMYFRLLGKYPSDFINAALAVDAGYLNPFDMTHTDVYTWGAAWLRVDWSPNEEIGLTQNSKIPCLYESLTTFADNNNYVNIPVLGYIVMPGGYLWFCILLAAWLLWKKKYRYLFLFTFFAGYYITLLLGPTVQLRYIYPVMVSLPFLIVVCTKEKWN